MFIDAKCPVTTPYDVSYNQENCSHGSCGLGVGATLNREAHYYSLTFGDLFYPWVLATKLKLLENFYQGYSGVALNRFLNCCDIVTHSSYIQKTDGFPAYPYSDYIFEGAQGLLLDAHYGFFPHVTRGNTGSQNIVRLVGNVPFQCYLVTRAYQTRHGLGPMSNEHLPHNISQNPDETNQTNRYQGSLRRSLLDVSLLEYAIQKDDAIARAKERFW